MIYEVEGDILLTRAQLVVHHVTTFDPMNRGIARKLKDKYPAMAEAFHLWCERCRARGHLALEVRPYADDCAHYSGRRRRPHANQTP